MSPLPALLAVAALASGFARAADLQIRFLDVGQGDAILVTTPDGKSMAYDAGRPRDLAASLIKRYGVTRLDLAVASQADADHFGGFEGIAEQLRPRVFLNNGLAKTTQTYARVIAAFRAAGSQGLLASDRTIELGSTVKLRVLPAPAGVPRSNQNANSVGILLTYGPFKAFFGGDAEPVETRGWASGYGSLLKDVDVYKALHHGSKHNDTADFLRVVSPRDVVIGVGRNNYGHPSSEALALYKGAGAAVFRTDLNGTVTVTVKPDGSYRISAEKGLGTERSARSTATRTPTAPANPGVVTPPPANPAAPAARGTPPPLGRRARCSDFGTRAEASAYMRAHGATYLDGNGDGVACESLP